MPDESTDGKPLQEPEPTLTVHSQEYEPKFTEEFKRATDKEWGSEFLEKAIREILANPYSARNSELLRHQWAGFRAARYRGSLRIIFRVCEECVQKHMQTVTPLPCCELCEAGVRIVRFVHFGDYHATRGNRKITLPSSFLFRDPT